ncbi:hypothetical protein CVT24_002175 [Panaeolus cyanescens]|uniref:Chromosome transmission fidelity protein 8 n=1 Tax=Panaeolus cyanescens TaxID=181874 RepID=A0A409YHZ5_9AGAR|nr:hypothetical protein CVT24_002175 [Panaeolus cyanescens]
MIIPITLNTPSSSSSTHSNSTPKLPSGLAKISNDEVVLIELQGFLEVEVNTPEERNGKFVGKLKIDDTGKPSLLIGHHLLEGKIAPLAKPLAIFHRTGGSSHRITGSGPSSSAEKDTSDDTPRKRRRTTRDGNGMVKKKIIFSKRPMPISSLPGKK